MSYPIINPDKLIADGNFTQADINSINKTLNSFHNNTQLSIARIIHGKVSTLGAIKTNNKVYFINNPDAVFEIGSITKVFTSFILVNIAHEGLLDIDDTIDKYLGYSLNNNTKTTFKELSNHTAGLPRIPPGMLLEAMFSNKNNPYKDYTEDRLIDYLKNKLKRKKKTAYRYSNLGAGLLGYVLSQVTGKSYEELLQYYIARPLHMSSTTTDRNKTKGQLVTGLNKKGKPTDNWDLSILTGAGSILSTAKDLAVFALSNFDENNSIFKHQHHKTFEANRFLSLALGWHILKVHKPPIDKFYSHEGGTGGYRSFIGLDLSQKNGIVLLSNVSGLYLFKGNKITHLALDLVSNSMNKADI